MTGELRFQTGHDCSADTLGAVFRTAFTASEGAAEGDSIASLFADLIRTTPAGDLDVISAWRAESPVACIVLTRLRYSDDARHVVLLAPVAVIPDAQRSGVGQALIAHGLEVMRSKGAAVAVTYGDPKYYSKSGFVPVGVDIVPPPYSLSMPFGWQAMTLDTAEMVPLEGTPVAAPGWANPALW